MQDVNILEELFLSTDIWGYLGPFIIVLIGYVLVRKDAVLGVIWFIVECLFIAQYIPLAAVTPFYYWHIFIISVGGVLTLVLPLAGLKKW